jgi:FixJ family two-component response regulator
MTANALPEQIRSFEQAGMQDHVAKPFKQHELYEAIRRVIEPSPAESRISPLAVPARIEQTGKITACSA